jgi:hypothetical protein
MTKRRLGVLSLVVLGLGFGTLAIASGDTSSGARIASPEAVDPAAEAPPPAFLQLRERAIAQPRGELTNGPLPATPVAISPQR